MVAEGGPGQVGDIQGDNRSLQKTRAGLLLLDSWGNGEDAGTEAQNNVDRQEELVHSAAVSLDYNVIVIYDILLFHCTAYVSEEDKQQNKSSKSKSVAEESGCEEAAVP